MLVLIFAAPEYPIRLFLTAEAICVADNVSKV